MNVVTDTHQIRCHTVRIFGAESGHGDLFSELQRLFPIRFETLARSCPGELLLEAEAAANSGGEANIRYSLTLPEEERADTTGGVVDSTIQFTNDVLVPFPFRGRTLRVKTDPVRPLLFEGSEKVLATTSDGPVWSLAEKNGVRHFRSAFALPRLSPSGHVHEVLNGDRFLELLPLLQWLRTVSAGSLYEGPSLRACFIFDDPNLHWPTYGRIGYRDVINHAERENYHVSFATIPLDTWFTHRPTAALFRASGRRISLLVHGNDHIKRELARAHTSPERGALLAQAIRRIQRLERIGGVQVSRVMVPPHGACSEEMLAALPKQGFESACISHGSLRAHNRSKPWAKSTGILPSELIHGCPVLPRWGFAVNVNNAILLAAYLNQPLILRGHHQDLKGGVELLDEHARFINGLGTISWANMSDLTRMNYQERIEGDVHSLRPFTRSLVWPVPPGATQLKIESAADRTSERWAIRFGGQNEVVVKAGVPVTLPANHSTTITASVVSPTVATDGVYSNRWSTSAVVRRLLTEGRDRFLP